MRNRKKTTKTERSQTTESETSTLDGDGRLAPLVHDEHEESGATEEGYEGAASNPAPRTKLPESSKASETNDSEIAEVIVGQFDEAGRFEWPIDRSKVDVVRERESTFIVFIDQSVRIRWLAAFAPSALADESHNVIARARLLAATPTPYFKEGQQQAWMRMIGESLALALSGDVQNSQLTLFLAETFVASRARETARLWYVKASLLAFIVLAVCGGLLSVVPTVPLISQPEAATRALNLVGLAVLLGVVGSQFSVLLRLSTLNVDPGAGRDAHYVDAVVRILLGAFAAVIAVVAVEANVALGFMRNSDANEWLIPAVAILAGTSERFVPGILRKVETTMLEEESMVDGKHVAHEHL